jgi:hypothetical protein
MKAYRGSRSIAPRNLNLGARWRRVVTVLGENLGTYWLGGEEGDRVGLDVWEKRKILALGGIRTVDRSDCG